MEFIRDLLHKLGNEYLYWTLIGIIALVIIIFLCIVLHVSRKKARAEKTKEAFKQASLQSLTPEEIDNISNNSANPEEVKEYLTSEVSVKPTKKSTKKTATKAKTAQKTKSEEAESKSVKATKSNNKPAEKQVSDDKKPAEKKQPTRKNTADNQSAETKQANLKKSSQPEKEEVKKLVKKEPAQIKKVVNQKPVQVKQAPQKQVEPEPKRQYAGKWKISQEQDGFVATLTASNGGTLLRTEKYKSLSGVKNGIETIKKNIDGGNFAISVDKYGHYRFKLFNLSNRLICMSEDYSSKNKCENGIESVKRFAKTDNVIMEEK